MANIDVKDVANAIAILDICVKRGAIEGNELTAVGTVRDKLAKFVEENTPTDESVDTDNASD